MSSIRRAGLTDVGAIVDMGLAFMRTTIYGLAFKENPAQLTKLATQMLDGSMDAAIFLAETNEGEPIGMVGLMAYDHLLSAERCAIEVFWYASPEARGSIGVRLLKAAEQWALDSGAVLLQMIAPAGAERVNGIYRALKYTAIESAWQKRLAEG